MCSSNFTNQLIMELECEKYKEKMDPVGAHCRHPEDYCKYRTSCVIHFSGINDEDMDSGTHAEPEQDTVQKVNRKIMINLNFKKSKNGLLPAIAQDYKTGEILMLAFINDLAWQKTLETGKAHYWSRSRNQLWLKGESSGHVQIIKEILVDCDEDTVIYKVEQLGDAACHKGYISCFYRRVEGNSLAVHAQKVFDPDNVYGK